MIRSTQRNRPDSAFGRQRLWRTSKVIIATSALTCGTMCTSRRVSRRNGVRAYRSPGLVDAMVLSGCRINSSLTKNEKLQTQGGTNRHKPGTEGPKGVKSKANPHWSRCSTGELSGGEQDR